MSNRLTRDTRIDDLELSVRTTNVLRYQGLKTLGEAWDSRDHLKQFAKGWGAKSAREITEIWRELEAQDKDLLKSPEYQSFVREDKLTSIQALMQEVDRRLLRVAIKDRVSGEVRQQMATLLRQAAEYVEQLPSIGETDAA